MRRLFHLLACLGLLLAGPTLRAAPSPAPAGLHIVRVFSGWRDAASFKRISEYFDGRENTGGETILRTHPDQRAGYYFLVRLAHAGATLPVKISLQLIAAGEAKPRLYSFAEDLKNGESVLQLGLTGTDWPDPKANPVAWKLDVLSADGQTLATEESYVWAKPAGIP